MQTTEENNITNVKRVLNEKTKTVWTQTVEDNFEKIKREEEETAIRNDYAQMFQSNVSWVDQVLVPRHVYHEPNSECHDLSEFRIWNCSYIYSVYITPGNGLRRKKNWNIKLANKIFKVRFDVIAK